MDVLDVLDPLLVHDFEEDIDIYGFPSGKDMAYRNKVVEHGGDSQEFSQLVIAGDQIHEFLRVELEVVLGDGLQDF